MLRKIAALFLSLTMTLGGAFANSVFAADDAVENTESVNKGRTLAFPDARGGGMYASGAREALLNGTKMEVYHVTNLNDSGKGSFRDAVSSGNRIIVFDVSGYIDLKSNVNVGGKGGNLTILGQTAPGDGICFRGNNIKISGENIIMRYLRFRVGDKINEIDPETGTYKKTTTQDGLEITDDTKNVIVDHCSVSWGTDENFSAYAVKDVTIQNCIIAEALNQSIHDKNAHSYAAIWGGVNLSIYHNLIATHKSRNPKIGTSETTAMTAGYFDKDTLVDMRNNVFYNWEDKAGYGAENDAQVNIINNWYRPGPATPDSGTEEKNKMARIFEYSAGTKYNNGKWSGHVWADGNHIDVPDDASAGAKKAAETVNNNNFQSQLKIGVYPEADDFKYSDLKEENKTYIKDYPMYESSAEEAYNYVLENAGARLPKPDKVDERIINDVINRTAPNTNNQPGDKAPNGQPKSVGLVDSPVDAIPKGEEANYDDRGYPKITSESRADDFDKDGDGIPDIWEESMGLDKQNPNDSLNIGPDGYTWLEIYAENIGKEASEKGINISDVTVEGDKALVKFALTQGTDGKEAKSLEFYCDGECIDTLEISGENIPTEKNITVPQGENYVTVKRVNGDGTFALSNTKVIYIHKDSYTGDDFTNTSAGGNVSKDGNTYYMYANGNTKAAVSKENAEGDFVFSADMKYVSNLVNGVQTGINIVCGNKSVKLYKTYEDNAPVWKFESALTGGDVSKLDTYKDNILRVTKNGGSLSLQAGASAADLKTVFTSAEDFKGNLNIEVYTLGTEGKTTVSEFENITYIPSAEVTQPKIKLLNISDNQSLEFNEKVKVKVTPDAKSAVNEIAIFFKNNVIKDIFYDNGITGEQEIEIPITFSNADEGTLRIVCFDKNLGMGEASANVVVSADITPWEISNIGGTASDTPAYVQGTNDYTYKIFAPDGNISGTSDKFGYMYQKFDKDARFIYRAKINSEKYFGLMVKKDLDPDGVSYYFGYDPEIKSYALKSRTEKGGEYVTSKTEAVGLNRGTSYIIAEKAGNKLSFYLTPGDKTAAHYKTKTLVAETDILPSDQYYIGFAATKEEAGTQWTSDAGWTVIESMEKNNPNSYVWDMDNGLDWWWQYPENKTVVPGWTNENVGGNNTGKLFISTNSDYTEKGTIMREFNIEQGVVESGFDILASGEKPSINLYLQTERGYAYNVGFDSDNTISFCGNSVKEGENAFEYSNSSWYKVKIKTEIGSGKADIALYNSDGNLIEEQKEVPAEAFSTINTIYNKNIPVNQGLFITPKENAQGSYYIDNMYVSLSIKSSLERAVADAEALNESEYTIDSWNALKRAVKKAKNVLSAQNPSAEEISEAYNNIIDALDALEILNGEIQGEEIFWNFSEGVFKDMSGKTTAGTYDNLLVIPGGSDIDTKGKPIDGIGFSKRFKFGTNHIKINAPGKCDIIVYAASASGSEERTLVISDGINSKEYNLTSGAASKFTYNGSTEATIDIYGKKGLNYLGIKYIPYITIDRTTTAIKNYDASTGALKVFKADDGITSAVADIVVTDNEGKVIEEKRTNISFTKTGEQDINIGKPSKTGTVKILIWESIETMKPICKAYEVY